MGKRRVVNKRSQLLLEILEKHPDGELTQKEKEELKRQWEDATQGKDVVIKGSMPKNTALPKEDLKPSKSTELELPKEVEDQLREYFWHKLQTFLRTAEKGKNTIVRGKYSNDWHTMGTTDDIIRWLQENLLTQAHQDIAQVVNEAIEATKKTHWAKQRALALTDIINVMDRDKWWGTDTGRQKLQMELDGLKQLEQLAPSEQRK